MTPRTPSGDFQPAVFASEIIGVFGMASGIQYFIVFPGDYLQQILTFLLNGDMADFLPFY